MVPFWMQLAIELVTVGLKMGRERGEVKSGGTGQSKRLDQALVDTGLVPARSKARDLVLRGFVLVDGAMCKKPSRMISERDTLALVRDAPQHVSRGGEKLAAAIKHFGFEASGKIALDIGASTGGFSEVLLSLGTLRIYAVDVGRDQLHPSLKADERVISLEGKDARSLTVADIPETAGAIVADVSFVSLTKVMGTVLKFAAPGAWLAALIKPQFELSPADIGKGGVVRSAAARQLAVDTVRTWICQQDGWKVIDVIPSPILGGSGNEEFLLGAVKNG